MKNIKVIKLVVEVDGERVVVIDLDTPDHQEPPKLPEDFPTKELIDQLKEFYSKK